MLISQLIQNILRCPGSLLIVCIYFTLQIYNLAWNKTVFFNLWQAQSVSACPGNAARMTIVAIKSTTRHKSSFCCLRALYKYKVYKIWQSWYTCITKFEESGICQPQWISKSSDDYNHLACIITDYSSDKLLVRALVLKNILLRIKIKTVKGIDNRTWRVL